MRRRGKKHNNKYADDQAYELEPVAKFFPKPNHTLKMKIEAIREAKAHVHSWKQ